MLGNQSRHDEFLNWLQPRLQSLLATAPYLSFEYEDVICKALILNLYAAIPILASCYSKAQGRPGKYFPVNMFRSTILMVSAGMTSPSEWANRLTRNPLLTLLCSFESQKTPSAGTIYDFWDRLYLQDKALRIQEKNRLRKKRKKPKNTKKGEKLPERQSGVCQRLLQSYRKSLFLSSKRPERLLQLLVTKVFVDEFIAQNILPSTMHVAADGSLFETASSPYGKQACSC